MELLKQRILQDGKVKPGHILKVDSFLNHQMDIPLLDEIGAEFARRFAGVPVSKILTIEASGIGIAAIAARHFGNVPVIFAKKTKSKNLDGDILTAQVTSYTRGTTFDIQVESKFVNLGDHILILDDFLARGQALLGLIQLVQQAGATIAGCGIVIEKGFQDGGELVRQTGVRLESLAVIKEMSDDSLVFAD
ncbi:xanthine phosphoribosyltransferase [Bittarella massiliensis]|uniref:xanthine phosphoribosyltransferase n=1 Tax=Bittarella massiliensis (ex Durand et al. 2017) TaxID=1720313 RepID=UPI00163CA89D|nr:xanthine phosphoribosyltransferase [Bittarella massiliensis (ex Durand et al. 2017)]MBC2872452.1 xanthine phosphoribosyltransferase [Bittarella massiliensis (ex Durand et al. 2017)]